MTNDRKRRNTSGWTPQDIGVSAVKLGIASMASGVIGKLTGSSRRSADRYPRPVQGSAERRRRMRQQERLTRRAGVEPAHT